MRQRCRGLWLCQLVFETDDAEFDFEGDGTDEPAHVSAVFTR